MGRTRRTIAWGAVAALMALGPADATASSPVGTTVATVPNVFHRTCSRITHQCGRYRQLNPPYLPGVVRINVTTRCYCWEW